MQHLARTPRDVGHALRETRRQHKLTQKQLAAASGIWQETISKVENGLASTRLETLFDLLAALDLEIVLRQRSKADPADLEKIF